MRNVALVLPAFALFACEVDSGFSDGGNDITKLTDGAIAVSTQRIIIDNVDVGFTKSATFTVSSVGEDNLTIYSASLVGNPDGVFTFEERNQTDILPSESQDWSVAATLPAPAMVEGVLRIESNDADTPDLRISICAVTKDYEQVCPTEGEDTGDTGGTDTGDTGDTDTGDTGDTGGGDTGDTGDTAG